MESLFFILLAGWILDLLLGDPMWMPHPVVYMGKWISCGEHRLNKGRHRKVKGGFFAVISILLTFLLACLLLGLVTWLSFDYLYVILSVILVFFCLAGKTLRDEVRMVFEAVDRSLEEGRHQVARIVGRDTSELDAQEIRTAALETLAENLSDGVIAPLFWFALLGVPGMLMYKMINTLDSMIGYHSERYKDFGCWAARIDDIANYIPARITALLMVLASFFILKFPLGSCLAQKFSLFSFVRKYGSQHASPNSGYPEAALAGILDCRFGGPHNYFGEYFYKPYIGTNPRTLTTADMKTSIRVCFIAESLAVVLLSVLILYIK